MSAPNLADLSGDENRDIDELISVPYADAMREQLTFDEKISYVKELLSEQKSQIKLHDFLISELRRFLSETAEDQFAVTGGFSDEEFLHRISTYEYCAKDLAALSSLLAYWAKESELSIISKIISRASDRLIESQGGLTIWASLRWYPLLLLLYHSGIAAIESGNYKSLSCIFYTRLGETEYGNTEPLFVHGISNAVLELTRTNVFKKVPGHERYYTPISEYLFKQAQPTLDDLFFLGRSYEAAFDEFEVLYALVVADSRKQAGRDTWGPIGRFGWKHRSRGNSPFTKIRNEAASWKNEWPPLKAGMFGGSHDRLEAVASEFSDLLGRLNWF